MGDMSAKCKHGNFGAYCDKCSEEGQKALELLKRIRQGGMILPSMLARNWEAYALLREVDELLSSEPQSEPVK